MNQPESPRPGWLRWAQVAWVVIVAVNLLMYAAGSVLYQQQLRQICTAAAEQCAEFEFVTPAGAAQLAARGLSVEAYGLLRAAIRFLLVLVPVGLGILIFVRRRDEPMALLVSLFLVTFGTASEANAVLTATYPAMIFPVELIGLVSNFMLPLFFGLFPNGRMVPRLYWAVVIYFGGGFLLQTIFGLAGIDSPLGSGGIWSWTAWLSVLLGGVAAQVYRYRRFSTPVERQQTRWVLFGLGLMATLLLSLLLYVAIAGDSTIGTAADPDFLRRFVFLVIGNLTFEFVYLSIGLAILRSKLFDIDVIIRKTLVYGVLTAVLALAYFGTVIVLQTLFGSLTGEQSPVVIVVSTLVIAALFSSLRGRVQAVIDRRFFRQKYDAEKTLAAFAQFARDEVELAALTAEMAKVVEETMRPAGVAIWLKETVPGRQSVARAPYRRS